MEVGTWLGMKRPIFGSSFGSLKMVEKFLIAH